MPRLFLIDSFLIDFISESMQISLTGSFGSGGKAGRPSLFCSHVKVSSGETLTYDERHIVKELWIKALYKWSPGLRSDFESQHPCRLAGEH